MGDDVAVSPSSFSSSLNRDGELRTFARRIAVLSFVVVDLLLAGDRLEELLQAAGVR